MPGLRYCKTPRPRQSKRARHYAKRRDPVRSLVFSIFSFSCFSVSLFQCFKAFQVFHAVSMCFRLFQPVSACFRVFLTLSFILHPLSFILSFPGATYLRVWRMYFSLGLALGTALQPAAPARKLATPSAPHFLPAALRPAQPACREIFQFSILNSQFLVFILHPLSFILLNRYAI